MSHLWRRSLRSLVHFALKCTYKRKDVHMDLFGFLFFLYRSFSMCTWLLFFSIILHGSYSVIPGDEGHTLKNRFCHVWANCSMRKQDLRPGSSVTPSNSELLSFYGDAARHLIRAGRKKRGCGQSVMSKKALEDRRAPASGALTSAPLIDWFAPRQTSSGLKEKKTGVKQHDASWDVKSLWNIVRLIPLGHQR